MHTHLRLVFVFAAATGALFAGSAPSGPHSPTEALRLFSTPSDLRIELVLAEPEVRQPVHLSFDERGRMWVVQYLQYPHPAGLRMLSRDGVWRAVYDRVPPPPPQHFRGEDCISIHEDTNGDGVFDKHKKFLEGLNIVTAVAHGRGGVWVLNPPYLLFYRDADRDDVPDGDPEVHLSGFGLEDTHSVVNSLCWGPDGWLYAAQGSTVSANVRKHGTDAPPVRSMGQLIWRYHPELRQYEIFAEGGGNAFGVEIDNFGRTFSGHNGGDTRGFHYVQGGYSLKGFAKHGPLSNPYAFGYFPPMRHNAVPRFTHAFTFYDGDALSEHYRGRLFGVAPLLHHVVLSERLPDGSTFQTRDIGHAVKTTDPWFTPVDIKHGPDGALYIADWYDDQCNHYRNHEGRIDKSNGRVYRLTGTSALHRSPQDLAAFSAPELVKLLEHPNRWHRDTALRLLGDRHDQAAIGPCNQLLNSPTERLALAGLWGLHLSGGLDEARARELLLHRHPQVRLWTVRLLCDQGKVAGETSSALARLARTEPSVFVRSQLACSARRLPVDACLGIVRPLLDHDEDAEDPHVPLLLWWAIESKVANHADAVLALFAESELWQRSVVRRFLLERLMRRLAGPGQRKDLEACAKLLKLCPNPEDAKLLLVGFEAAFSGRTFPELPPELAQAVASYSKYSLAIALRQGKEEAFEEALRVLQDERAEKSRQVQYLQILGEVHQPKALGTLLKLATGSPDSAVRGAALLALQRYDDPDIAPAILAAIPQMTDDVRPLAWSLLTSRTKHARQLLAAVAAGRLAKESVPRESVQRLGLLRDDAFQAVVRQLWGDLSPAAPADLQKEIERLSQVVQAGSGVPKHGRSLFQQHCGKCHALFGEGGRVGPDLTAYNRSDLQTMLLSIVHPNAEIREGYATYVLLTRDGRTMVGCLVEQDPQVVVLRGDDGKDVPIPRSEIDSFEARKTSLMPEGLLKPYTDQQVRDLLAYLRCTQPLIDR